MLRERGGKLHALTSIRFLVILNMPKNQKKRMPIIGFRIFIEQDEDDVFVAECPTLPGCISQGKTRKEALENIQDAIKGYLASLRKHKEPIPSPIQEEIVEVSF
jgi:predicted RNase H-like HicB family nuclease